MFYYFLPQLSDHFILFNLFNYISFRSGGAIITALLITLFFGPKIISLLKRNQKNGQPIRDDGPIEHIIKKKGTPTMGGFMILFSLAISIFLWADLRNIYVWTVIIIMVGFGLVGFLDDYLKLYRGTSKGISAKLKILLQIIVAFISSYLLVKFTDPEIATTLAFPFFKNLMIDLGIFFIPFSIFVIVGSSNSVNLTDGLDGLAIVPVMVVAASFAAISYLVGNAFFANYLQIPFVGGAGELTIICASLVGAGLGFLWFNAPPAMVFMGDTGSLSLGGILGTVSVVTKNEFVLAIIGGMFVLETISVMVQVISFKLTGKRIFKMAPIHHHFEKKGWPESTIVVRFWIITVILALIGLVTLKIR